MLTQRSFQPTEVRARPCVARIDLQHRAVQFGRFRRAPMPL
jgi:hypothetical protein